MSAANLKLSQNSAYSIVHVPMLQIAEWWRDGTLRPTVWQRAPRWKAGKDNEGWISCVLQNTPIVPIFAHQRERSDGTLEYCIIDGQNRSAACAGFLLEQSVTVRAGHVLHTAPAPDERMAFGDFSLEQQERIAALLIPVCLFNPDTTDGELRRVFTALNKGKMLTSYEIIRSWTHLPIVNDVFNVVDERLCPRVQHIVPRWRAQNHRMMHTWAKIGAIVWSDGLHLPNADRVEQWVASQTGSVPDAAYFESLVDYTIGVIEGWHANGVVPAIFTVPDLAWAIHTYLNCTDHRRLFNVLIDTLRIAVHNEVDQAALWTTHAGGVHIDNVRARRAFIARVVSHELGIEDMPPNLGRTQHEQPSDGVVTPEPTMQDIEAAEALLSLMPQPRVPDRPEALAGWQPVY
jgi:hypothetical protein